MDPNDQKKASEAMLCPDCNRLLTSDDWMDGDPPNLRIHRRPWPSSNKILARWCMLCAIICGEFDFREDWIVEDHLILGYRLQNDDPLEKKTLLKLMWINKRKRVGGVFLVLQLY